MSNLLYRLGRSVARRRRLVVVVWIAVALLMVGINRTGGGGTVDNFEVPGVESQQAVDLLKERFPERAGATAMVVFHTSQGSVADPANAAGIEATVAAVRTLDHVVGVTEPLASPRSISPDGSTAFASVQFDSSSAELGRGAVDALVATAAPAEAAGVQVEYGGELPTVMKQRTTGPAEMIGVIAALIILFVTFRSVYSAILPLGVALVGLVVGLSIVGLLGALIEIPSVAPRLGTMIGLGVGIDYALFILSRHRDNLEAGMPREESIGRTNATAGQAVVVAGGTVVVALFGLQLAHAISEFHGGRRFDKDGFTGTRAVVDDPAHISARTAPHRHHPAPVANGDRKIRHLMMRLQLCHLALKQPHQFSLGATQILSYTTQRRRRIVLHRPVIGNCTMDCIFLGAQFNEISSHGRQNGLHHRRPTRIIQCGTLPP